MPHGVFGMIRIDTFWLARVVREIEGVARIHTAYSIGASTGQT